MADKKITQLIELTAVADDDYLAVVDTSATVTKKIRKDNLFAGFLPTGAMIDYAGNSEPDGWVFCNGQALNRTTYAALFAAIGTTFGVGDGSTTFNVPDLSGRVSVGYNGSDSDFSAVGNNGGEKNHTLTTSEMPVHAHGITQSPHSHGVSDPGHGHTLNGHNSGSLGEDGAGVEWSSTFDHNRGGGINGSGTGIGIQGANANISCNNAGSGAAHNNMQPYLVARKIIKF